MFSVRGPQPKRPVLPPRYMLKTFYIYDPGLKERDYLAGFPVKREPETGLLFVLMTAKQAEYWVTLGTMGPVPRVVLRMPRRSSTSRFRRTRLPIILG